MNIIAFWALSTLCTLIIGNMVAYSAHARSCGYLKNRNVTRLRAPTLARFLLRQFATSLRHPKAFLLMLGFSSLPILGLLMILIDKAIFDVTQIALSEAEDASRRSFKELHGMNWRIISQQDAIDHSKWRDRFIQEHYTMANLVEKLSIVTGKAMSFATLVLGLLFAPFGLFVPKAGGQTREDRQVGRVIDPKEAPFDPGHNDVHGALALGTSLSLPTTTGGMQATHGVRQLDLKVLPEITREISVAVVLAMTRLANDDDPILVASLDWRASERLSLKAGRVLNPVGLYRQAPPQTLIELTRPDLGITSPFFEHGVLATYADESIEVNAGLLTGHGLSSESDLLPDLAVSMTANVTDALKLGFDAQTGKQNDGLRHVVGLNARLDTGTMFMQAESVGNLDTDNTRPTIGAYLLGALRPNKIYEVYARIEAWHDLRSSSDSTRNVASAPQHHDSLGVLGLNFKPLTNFALRVCGVSPITRQPTIGLDFAAQATF